jgi:hypothetical protein
MMEEGIGGNQGEAQVILDPLQGGGEDILVNHDHLHHHLEDDLHLHPERGLCRPLRTDGNHHLAESGGTLMIRLLDVHRPL